LDHHELSEKELNEKIHFINPHLFNEEQVSAAGICYLFAKSLGKEDKDMANLAVIGMVGDVLEKEISKLNNEILNDAEIKIQKGLLLYPSTRPIHKTLEYSSVFIPGVTGDSSGVFRLLSECEIKKENGTFKSLLELTEEELSRLITGILLRTKTSEKEIIGNIYLVKFFNKLNDAREISAMVNACSRLGYSEIALSLCLQNEKSKKKAEDLYVKYKQEIVKGLNFVQENKIEGKNYAIINAKNNIKDTVIGTIMSILTHSMNREAGVVVIGMAYKGENIKVSARISGDADNKNVREILDKIVKKIGGECGGHKRAAGCIISKENEEKFIEDLKKSLEVEIIKI
jgi:RecJ-like exonuclease